MTLSELIVTKKKNILNLVKLKLISNLKTLFYLTKLLELVIFVRVKFVGFLPLFSLFSIQI